jgi:hypothetical protein
MTWPWQGGQEKPHEGFGHECSYGTHYVYDGQGHFCKEERGGQ